MDYHWQDIVLSVSNLVFGIALIPSIRGKNKPALSTSLITTIFLSSSLVAYISLALWYTAFTTSINALCWGTLAVQKARQKPITQKNK